MIYDVPEFFMYRHCTSSWLHCYTLVHSVRIIYKPLMVYSPLYQGCIECMFYLRLPFFYFSAMNYICFITLARFVGSHMRSEKYNFIFVLQLTVERKGNFFFVINVCFESCSQRIMGTVVLEACLVIIY